MARDNSAPPCPHCKSSATLPFENEGSTRAGESFTEIILTVFLLILAFFCIFLILLLSHAGLPVAVLAVLVVLLFWRQKKERRRSRPQPQRFICLDCSRNFKA